MRPCGQCIGCRLEKARQWAMRCMHEAQLHEECSFITLTYNNESLPYYEVNGKLVPTLCKEDFQRFMKRLRKKITPREVRYYACGEYGDRLGRPHYHAILFGYDFEDKNVLHQGAVRSFKKTFQKSIVDNTLYTSETLEKVWGFGFVTIGEVTFESAGYVARYCTKKITGKRAIAHYKGKEPEFALMSRMPGIGKEWFEKYQTDVYPKDFVTLRGIKMQPPRYYDDLLEKQSQNIYNRVKEARLENRIDVHPDDRVREDKYKKMATKSLKRSLENEKS